MFFMKKCNWLIMCIVINIFISLNCFCDSSCKKWKICFIAIIDIIKHILAWCSTIFFCSFRVWMKKILFCEVMLDKMTWGCDLPHHFYRWNLTDLFGLRSKMIWFVLRPPHEHYTAVFYEASRKHFLSGVLIRKVSKHFQQHEKILLYIGSY